MIIVTGSCGRVGKAVCRELDAHGLDWQGVDIVAVPQFTPSGRFAHRQCDLRSFGATIEMLSGADAVIHLAAVAYPSFKPNHETFLDNVAINYNLFSAAILLGIPRIVWVSSEEVYGLPYDQVEPRYFPINERHPLLADNAYGLSKCVSETMAEQLSPGTTTSFISLRSTLVQDVDDYPAYPGFEADPAVRRWALWSYIDSRDLARACRLALDAKLTGAHAFSIAAPDTAMTISSIELAARFFPNVERRWPGDADRFASFCDTRRAAEMLGFRAEHLWRDQLDRTG